MMVEVQWYYARNDKQHGPVTAADLKQLAASGQLHAVDLIWREGMEEWTPAGRLKGLFPDARPGVGAGYGIAAQPAGASPAGPSGHAGALHLGLEPEELLSATPSAPLFGAGAAQPFAPPGPMMAGRGAAQPPAPAAPLAPPHSQTTAPPLRGQSAADPAAETRTVRLSTPMALLLLQAFLWGTCVLVVLVGIALFTGAFLRAKTPTESAAAGVVFVTFFIAAYVLARAGEKASQLMIAYLRRRGG
jgi:hypothetical protein